MEIKSLEISDAPIWIPVDLDPDGKAQVLVRSVLSKEYRASLVKFGKKAKATLERKGDFSPEFFKHNDELEARSFANSIFLDGKGFYDDGKEVSLSDEDTRADLLRKAPELLIFIRKVASEGWRFNASLDSNKVGKN